MALLLIVLHYVFVAASMSAKAGNNLGAALVALTVVLSGVVWMDWKELQ